MYVSHHIESCGSYKFILLILIIRGGTGYAAGKNKFFLLNFDSYSQLWPKMAKKESGIAVRGTGIAQQPPIDAGASRTII